LAALEELLAPLWCCILPSGWRFRCAIATCCWSRPDMPRYFRSGSCKIRHSALRARSSTSFLPAMSPTRLSANSAVAPLLEGAEPSLASPPVNVLCVGLHPTGLAPCIINFAEWRAHLLARVRRQIDLTADPILIALIDELGDYPTSGDARHNGPSETEQYANVLVPLKLVIEGSILSLFSMTTVFGTPVDITLSELAVESFLPADAATAEALHRLAAAAK
jgi:hypothetical protein